MNLETPTTIIAVFIVILVAGDGRQRIVIDVGGGSVTTAFIWISIITLRMRTIIRLAASRCRVTLVSAPVAPKCAVGIQMSIIFGTLLRRFQQQWMMRVRHQCDPKLDTEVAEGSAPELRS